MPPWLRRAGAAILVIGVAVVALAVTGGRMGLFAGSRPADLGIHDGRLRAGDWRPNWVSSHARPGDEAYVAPLAFKGDPTAAWNALANDLHAMPRARVVTRLDRYLHAEFATAVMGFVDDVEFFLDPAAGVIHVRSGARLGIRDFGVNRGRIEAIREGLSR